MNQLVIWNDLKLFCGSNPRAVAEHSHPVVQLVLAIQDSFLSKNETGDWIEKTGLLIAPNHFHECDANNVPILSIDIDPASALGEWIMNNQLKNQPVIDYPSNELAMLDFDDLSGKLENENWKATRIIIENTFHFQNTRETLQRDDRIESILDYISENIDQKVNTQSLMEVAHLSESRMLHLFKETMGLPIRNYILWYRLKIVFEQILAGNSLTHAAYQAGFSDQAHLTRTFIKMVGVPPSVLAKNSRFVQVSFPY